MDEKRKESDIKKTSKELAIAGYLEIMNHPEQLLLAVVSTILAGQINIRSTLEVYEKLLKQIVERVEELRMGL